MKRYAYFPGCSAETVSASYHLSTIETGTKLGVQFEEIEDWNCCGATPYTNIDELLAHTLCARNLAIAERTGLDVVAPCNACFKNLYHANQDLKKDADLAEHMNFALEADGLRYGGTIGVHHLIHVFVRDVGLDAIKQKVTHPLKGVKVAAYYGCQLVRPDRDDGFDSTGPRYFEDLVAALGAKPVAFPHRLRCCGASLMIGHRRAALTMVRELLRGAAQAAQPTPGRRHLSDRARQVDRGQVFVDGGRVDLPGRDAAAAAQARRRRVRVGLRQPLIREPGVGDEAAGTGGIHDIATPEGVDAQHRGRRHARHRTASRSTLHMPGWFTGTARPASGSRR